MSGISAVYSSKTINIVKSDYKDKNSFGMKPGSFILNGEKIVVKQGETLESLSQKINKHSNSTRIKAKIVAKDNGYKLQLISRNKLVHIFDNEGVLKNLYDKNYIGKFSKHLIQIIDGEFYYNKALPRQVSIELFSKLIKQYTQEPNYFVENALINLNEDHVLSDVEQSVIVDEVVENDPLVIDARNSLEIDINAGLLVSCGDDTNLFMMGEYEISIIDGNNYSESDTNQQHNQQVNQTQLNVEEGPCEESLDFNELSQIYEEQFLNLPSSLSLSSCSAHAAMPNVTPIVQQFPT